MSSGMGGGGIVTIRKTFSFECDHCWCIDPINSDSKEDAIEKFEEKGGIVSTSREFNFCDKWCWEAFVKNN